MSNNASSKSPPSPAIPPNFPPSFKYKVIDLGEIESGRFNSIMDQITKLWAKDLTNHFDSKPAGTFKDQLKSDFTNAAYRVGSNQILNITKNFLVQYARKSCHEESKVRAIAELLDTEIGTAIIAMFIGYAAIQVPQLASNPKMNRLLKEFRVGGMATIGNSAVESIIANMLPVISSALKEIEKTESSKIEETSLSSLEEELIIDAETKKNEPLLRQS